MWMLLVGVVLALGAAAIAVAMVRLLSSRDPQGDWGKQLANLQALLATVALGLTGIWYFFERPTQPKVDIEQTVSAHPLPDGRILVLAEVSLENVGSTSVNFRKAPVEFYLQQVLPLPPGVKSEMDARQPAGQPRVVHAADNWGAIAQLGKAPSDLLHSEIEAGEKERLYYRVVVDCRPGLTVYATTRIPKPNSHDLQWVKQTLLDLSEPCDALAADAGKGGPP
jgi:hypothetical protein